MCVITVQIQILIFLKYKYEMGIQIWICLNIFYISVYPTTNFNDKRGSKQTLFEAIKNGNSK